jgi:phenylalanyl-tRNA synthetase beta chain
MPAPPTAAAGLRAPASLFPQRDAVFELPRAGTVSEGDGEFSPLRVEIHDGVRCPRYAAALVAGVTVAPSPFWLRHRLHRLGLRPINNLVDATNYILLMFGHPIHAFDYARVRGSKIAVRVARPSETVRTLDGVARELTADDLLICDAEGPVALAGVMGGENSQIAQDTQRVLIECAYFDPRSVRRTSKRTGMHTDSSHRFERGVDPSAVRDVLAHASALIANLGAGQVLSHGLDVVAQKLPRKLVTLRLARVEALLGQAVPRGRVTQLLQGLGCELTDTEAGFDVVVPSHRPDLTREVDLIEEVSRLAGYDSLPSELPRITPSAEGTPAAITFVRRVREAAAAAGLLEAVNYAFVSEQDLKNARAPELTMRVVNPLSEERSVMRTALLPGLAANLRLAQSQQLKSFAQFELARVFFPRAGEVLPEERQQLGVLLWGERRTWYTEGELFDFYDAKGVVESIVRAVCGRSTETRLDPQLDADAAELHPRRRARLWLGEHVVGVIGELHPDVVAALELEGRPVWARLDINQLSEAAAALGPAEISALPRFPSATRDLAVLVPEALPAGEVEHALRTAAGLRASSVVLFDIYRGDPVPAGSKSLAFHVVYRDPEATLTDKVVDALHAKVVAVAEQRFGGSVRR